MNLILKVKGTKLTQLNIYEIELLHMYWTRKYNSALIFIEISEQLCLVKK